jgi:lipopolysaccharide export system permease protein
MTPFVLARYLTWRFLMSCGAVTAALAAFVFVINLAELLNRSSGKDEMTFGIAFAMAVFKLPLTLNKLLPFIALFGAIWMFARLSRHHELEAIRASGVSAWQFIAPPIVVAILAGAFSTMAINPIAANSASQFEQLEARYLRGRTSILAVFPTGVWLRQADDRGQAVIHALRASSADMALEDVIVFIYEGKDKFERRLDARSAMLANGYWQLTKVYESRPGETPVYHETYDFPSRLTPDEVKDSFTSPDTIDFWDLPRFIATAENAGFTAVRHKMHLYSLMALPLALGAMVVIAAAFALRPMRFGGTGRLLAMAAGVGFVFFFFSDFTEALGLSGLVAPVIAATAPTLTCILFGVTALLYLEDG